MNKRITHNKKISQAILYMIFSALFIIPALYKPTPTYAGEKTLMDAYIEDGLISQTPNYTYENLDLTEAAALGFENYHDNQKNESVNVTVSYLYWNAAANRCGVMYYVLDQYGACQARGVLLEAAGATPDGFGDYKSEIEVRKITPRYQSYGSLGFDNDKVPVNYAKNITPIGYDDSTGWHSTGDAAMEHLMSDSTKEIIIDGRKLPLPTWAEYVRQAVKDRGGDPKKVLGELAKPDSKWTVLIEPVSVNYLYTNDTFSQVTKNTEDPNMAWAKGAPKPLGAAENSYTWDPDVYLGTAYNLINESNNAAGQPGGNSHTALFYNTQLPYSMCLDHEISFKLNYTPIPDCAFDKIVTPPKEKIHRIYNNWDLGNQGVGIAALEINGFSFPLLHTYNGKSPDNTEMPNRSKATTGDCVIRKLYYTERQNSDGTFIEITNYQKFERKGTTEYISIDEEDGYEIAYWKTSKTDKDASLIAEFDAIPMKRYGTSAEEIVLNPDEGIKYLYVLLKKVETAPADPNPWDFRLEQSQITKRVSFTESATTSTLLSHMFNWTSSPRSTFMGLQNGKWEFEKSHKNADKHWGYRANGKMCI